jgi:hypothetical protein
MSDVPATDRFRRQHQELATLAADVLAHLEPPTRLANDPRAARRSLAVLAGKLRIHAAMEDEALYPRIAVHPNESLRSLAKRFHTEFGDVYKGFLAFVDTWTTEAIQERPDEFAAGVRAAMKALAVRVKAENEQFYSAIDAAETATL